jgi:hypothetical protein
MQKVCIFLILFISACKRDNNSVNSNTLIEFGQPVKVEIVGYAGNIMEPFVSRDGLFLLFNNLNAAPENTNLHWAAKINDSTFQYKGEIAGINTTDIEGVASLDNAGNLFFVSTRNYATTLSTIYQCNFINGTATNLQLINGISTLQPGWLNFDVEVSADGQTLYFVDSQFDQSFNPATADLIIAKKTAAGFQILNNSKALMQNINTNALEYAACISVDQLQLYFTRLVLPITSSSLPEMFIATRKNINDPFGIPSKIQSITGFVEGATIAPDQRTLYYHKKENNKFVLYLVRKK